MASINHLEMCNEVKALPQIQIKKTLFGLLTKITYVPTGSSIRVKQNEYNADAGVLLQNILSADGDKAVKLLQEEDIRPGVIGSIRLDACLSDDHQFVALQLLRFSDLTYQPITKMKVYEGGVAEAFCKLFE